MLHVFRDVLNICESIAQLCEPAIVVTSRLRNSRLGRPFRLGTPDTRLWDRSRETRRGELEIELPSWAVGGMGGMGGRSMGCRLGQVGAGASWQNKTFQM